MKRAKESDKISGGWETTERRKQQFSISFFVSPLREFLIDGTCKSLYAVVLWNDKSERTQYKDRSKKILLEVIDLPK